VKNKKIKKLKNNNKQKKVKVSKSLWLILALLLLIIGWAIYRTILFIQNPTDTFSVDQGRIYQEERGIGYIIREETIVKGSNYKNGIEKIKAEGERVAKNEAIFKYYSSDEENLKNKIKDLDIKIDEVIAKEDNLFSGDTKALEKQIVTDILSLRKVNSIQTITKVKKDISDNIIKKAKIAGELSPAGSYLNKLIKERSTYENQLNKGAEYLLSPISGVVSYKVDGYEDILTISDFSSLRVKSLEDLNIKTGQLVTDSKESAKIINNFDCYIATILNSEQAQNAEVGQNVKLRLSNNSEISSTIKHISKEEEKVIIVFEVNTQIQELISYRKISFDIVWWSDSGKKVPNDAIGYIQKGDENVAFVVRTRGGYEDKIWIKVIRQNNKYSIVDNYTTDELKNIGFTDEELKGRKTLVLYDEILEKPT